MGYANVSCRKIAEVYRDDGALRTLATAVRFGYGLARLGFLRRIARRPEAITRVRGNRMITNPYDPGIGSELIVRGIHEKHCTRELEKRLARGMHVIDIGANIGYYAIMEAGLVGPTGRVFAIEPVPGNVRLLERNVILNGYQDRVRTFQLAIGDVSGTATINLSTFSTRHSFVTRPERERAGSLEVPMVAFEDFVVMQDVNLERLGLIRMDVEGYEVKIIPGMADTLQRCRRLSLCIEFHQRKFEHIPGASWEKCLTVLRDAGAGFDRLHLGGPRGKEIIRDVTIQEFMASKRLMTLGGMESWLTIDHTRIGEPTVRGSGVSDGSLPGDDRTDAALPVIT